MDTTTDTCLCEKTICFYCELVYCPECVPINCQMCINSYIDPFIDPDSMACPNCSSTEEILDTLICHQCFYNMLTSGQLSYCLDCDDYIMIGTAEYVIFDIETQHFIITEDSYAHQTHRIIYGPEQKDIMISSTLNKYPLMRFNKKLGWGLGKINF